MLLRKSMPRDLQFKGNPVLSLQGEYGVPAFSESLEGYEFR